MNFNKLGLVALSAGAIFMATSCNKSQTLKLEDAKAWVDKHYTEKGSANPKSGKTVYDFSATSGEEARKYVVETFSQYGQIELNEDLKAEVPMTSGELEAIQYLKSTDFEFQEIYFDHLPTYIVSNNAMTIKYTNKTGLLPGVDMNAKFVRAFNSKGAPTKSSIAINDAKADGLGGVINGSIVSTYKY